MKFFFTKTSILLCLLSMLGLAWCLAQGGKDNSQTGKDNAPSVIAWNSLIYGQSGTEVSQSEIGKKLGEIKRIKRPFPIENGDSDDTPVGSKIFEIKGIEINDAIVIERDGKNYKFVKKDYINK